MTALLPRIKRQANLLSLPLAHHGVADNIRNIVLHGAGNPKEYIDKESNYCSRVLFYFIIVPLQTFANHYKILDKGLLACYLDTIMQFKLQKIICRLGASNQSGTTDRWPLTKLQAIKKALLFAPPNKVRITRIGLISCTYLQYEDCFLECSQCTQHVSSTSHSYVTITIAIYTIIYGILNRDSGIRITCASKIGTQQK